MTGREWPGKALLGMAYATPVLALVIYISLALFDVPVPLGFGGAADEHAEHIHEGQEIQSQASGAGIGTMAPNFEIMLVNGATLTLQDLLESGRPTFLYFWATT